MLHNFLVTMVQVQKWHEFTIGYNLHESYFQTILEIWELIVKENYENATNFIINEHHLIKASKIIILILKFIMLILKNVNKISSNIYFQNLFNDYNID